MARFKPLPATTRIETLPPNPTAEVHPVPRAKLRTIIYARVYLCPEYRHLSRSSATKCRIGRMVVFTPLSRAAKNRGEWRTIERKVSPVVHGWASVFAVVCTRSLSSARFHGRANMEDDGDSETRGGWHDKGKAFVACASFRAIYGLA